MRLEIIPVPAFTDNYIWLIISGRYCAVIDPGEAKPVRGVLEERDLEPCAILLTHHHHDHVGGVRSLLKEHPVPVWGPADERMPKATHAVGEGDNVTLPELGLNLRVIDVAGHTRSHIAYYSRAEGLLFCGDTLFSIGCGRLFEGTPEQMQQSLDKLAGLPDETLVYCAHEYTAANCRFALSVEPDNEALQQRCRDVEAMRAKNQPTLPSRLADERACNPFLRTRTPAVIAAARRHRPEVGDDPAAIFGVIRELKDQA